MAARAPSVGGRGRRPGRLARSGPRTILAIKLRVARYLAGLGQDEVAERLGIPRSTLANYEAGRTAPKWERRQAFARLYDQPLAAFADGATSRVMTGPNTLLPVAVVIAQPRRDLDYRTYWAEVAEANIRVNQMIEGYYTAWLEKGGEQAVLRGLAKALANLAAVAGAAYALASEEVRSAHSAGEDRHARP